MADLPAAAAAKTLTIPLGPACQRLAAADVAVADLPLTDRPYTWAFEGTGWNGRKEKLQALIDCNLPSRHILRPNWAAANYPSSDYITLLRATKFVPIMKGTNYETFRIYEALEHGCIPLICREEGDRAYYEWLRQHLPGLFAAPSWAAAGEFICTLTANKDVMQAYCDTIHKQWIAWKTSIQKAGREILGLV